MRRELTTLWAVGLVALGALLCAPPALADGGEKGEITFDVFGGYGVPDDYTSTFGTLAPEEDMIAGLRFGVFYTPMWSSEGSVQRLSTRTAFGPSVTLGDRDVEMLSARYNLLLNYRAGRDFRPYLTFGIGLEDLEVKRLIDDNAIGFNVGGGWRGYLGDRVALRWDLRYIMINPGTPVADGQRNLETTFGISWSFGGGPPLDTDGDGIIDRRDRCPDTPRGAVVDDFGCPEDSDVDGVPDGLDRCPDTYAGIPVDATGCARDSDSDGAHDGVDRCPGTPSGAEVDSLGCPHDGDGDGVYDGIDTCPDTTRGATVDARGCPSDGDGDRVLDGIDNCPGTPRGALVDDRGCPEDSDGDGVYDGLDRCPDSPTGVRVDERGCRVLFEEQRDTLVLEGVHFELNSDELTPDARRILDRVAMSLAQWPEIRVEVGGHTDSSGSDAHNFRLSQRRAETVRAYLAGQGAGGERLTARGYGESRPIADNTTGEGRRRNRRVELKRLN